MGVAACTLVLVVAGAFVTSKQAGLSVPDWPLSYGQVMPPMVGGVLYEHGHRMIATTVGFLTVILAIWLWRSEKRRWMRTLGLVAVGAVILQGVLGGLTVLLMLPPIVSILHACLAQLFFCTTVAIALFTSRSWFDPPRIVDGPAWPSLRTLAVSTSVLVLIQIALGAAFRHHALGIMFHVIGAMLVAGIVMVLGIFVLAHFPEHPALRTPALALLLITFVQLFVGIAAYLLRLQSIDAVQVPWSTVLLTVFHVAIGALTFGASVVLAIQVIRNVRVSAAVHIPNSLPVNS